MGARSFSPTPVLYQTQGCSCNSVSPLGPQNLKCSLALDRKSLPSHVEEEKASRHVAKGEQTRLGNRMNRRERAGEGRGRGR